MIGIVLPGFVVGPLLAMIFGIYWPVFRALPDTSRRQNGEHFFSCCPSSR